MGWLLPMEAQTDTLFLTPVIHLDSVVISEVADGFSVGEFIHLMEEDTDSTRHSETCAPSPTAAMLWCVCSMMKG